MKIKDKINLQPSIKFFNILCCANFKMIEIFKMAAYKDKKRKIANENEPKNPITAKTVLHV